MIDYYKMALSWQKCQINLFRLQNRIFKSILVGDKRKAFQMQKLISNSTSSYLLAIREVTQICSNRKIAGVDGKVILTFSERLNLINFLRENFYNWKPQRANLNQTFKKILRFLIISLDLST